MIIAGDPADGVLINSLLFHCSANKMITQTVGHHKGGDIAAVWRLSKHISQQVAHPGKKSFSPNSQADQYGIKRCQSATVMFPHKQDHCAVEPFQVVHAT